MDINLFSRRTRKKNVSLTLEEETIMEIKKLANRFKNLKRTEIMRFAIEFAIVNKEFEKVLNELDS